MSYWSEETYDMTPEQIGKVMHAEFVLGNTRMSAGDSFDCAEVNPDIIKLMIHMDTKEEALHTISVLAEGGTILSPLQPRPDNSGYGSVTKDRFGFAWIITCPNPAEQ